jgi:V/A-type H+-transporting ATPase subunit E
MGIEELVERLLRDAEDEARLIKERADDRRREILRAADAEAEKVYWQRFNAIRAAAEEDGKQRLAIETLEARNVILQEKRRLLDEVFEEAANRLLSLSGEKRKELLLGMLLQAASDGMGEVTFSPQDREPLGEEVVAEANRELERTGRRGNLVLAPDTADIRGGFILRAGGIEINSSIESILDSRREDLEAMLVEVLFSEDRDSGGHENAL